MLFFFEAKFAEIEERNSELDRREEGINGREKKVKDVVILLGKKREEIDRQMEEINTRKKCTEEYAEYLESKRKELEKGFQELNSRKAKFAGFSSIAGKCLYPYFLSVSIISLFFLTKLSLITVVDFIIFLYFFPVYSSTTTLLFSFLLI